MVRTRASSVLVLVLTDGLSSYTGPFSRGWRKLESMGRVGVAQQVTIGTAKAIDAALSATSGTNINTA